jgi:hypothetical protein
MKEVRHQIYRDTARPPAKQRPSEQVAADPSFAGPYWTGSLYLSQASLAPACGPAHAGELRGTRIAQQCSQPGLDGEQPAVGFQLASYQSSRAARDRPALAAFEPDPAPSLCQKIMLR